MFICEKCGNTQCNCGQPAETPASPPQSDDNQQGVVLRLVPPLSNETTEQGRAACRRILLEILTKIETGEVDELAIVTVNNKAAAFPYYFRWQFSDPVRMLGLLNYATTYIANNFITLRGK